jgi:hypothetical protein
MRHELRYFEICVCACVFVSVLCLFVTQSNLLIQLGGAFIISVMNLTLLEVISAIYFFLFVTVSQNNMAETHQTELKIITGIQRA